MRDFRWPVTFLSVAAVAAFAALLLNGLASLFFWVLAGVMLTIGLVMVPTSVRRVGSAGGGGRRGFIDD